MIKVLYFAWVRDLTGTDEEQVETPASGTTVRDLCAQLASRSEGHARAFADLDRLRYAIDLTMVGLDTPVGSAREIAFFPPVTGG
jgi:sulfur-carrier protein